VAIVALAVFALAGAAAPSFAGTVLSSNMNVATRGTFFIDNTNWLAAPFRTTTELTRVTDVSLDVFDGGDYFGGDLSVEIWTASNAGPTAFMQSILTSSFSSTPVSITGLSVMLQPNTDYAVVAKGSNFIEVEGEDGPEPGRLSWNVAENSPHTGNGFMSGLWEGGNSGSSWSSYPSLTLKMSVFAAPSAVPEIDPATSGSALALVAAVLAMIEQRRRRATLAA
jgi:hypothetical protein